MPIRRAMRFVIVGALASAAVALPSAASADTPLPAYNVTQPTGVPNAWVVAVDPESHRVYVAGAPNQTVVVLDGLTGSTLATITVPYTPSSMAIDPAAHRLFIIGDDRTTSKETVSISIVDTTTNAILTTVPGPFLSLGGLAVDTFNHRVLALPMVLDEKGRLITTSGPPVTFGGAGVAVDSSIQRLYVSNPATGVVTVYNSTTLRSVVVVKVSASPQAIAIDPQTHSVYVSDDTNGVVSVINGTTDKVTATIPVGATPTSLAVDSSAGLLYVSDPDTSFFQTVPSAVTVIDATDNAVIRSVTVSATGGGANGIAVDPTTHTVWVAADQMSELQAGRVSPCWGRPLRHCGRDLECCLRHRRGGRRGARAVGYLSRCVGWRSLRGVEECTPALHVGCCVACVNRSGNHSRSGAGEDGVLARWHECDSAQHRNTAVCHGLSVRTHQWC